MYIYGRNVAIEAIENENEVHRIWALKNLQDQKLRTLLEHGTIPVSYVDKRKLDSMVKGNHQGIVLQVPDYQYSDLEEFIHKDNALVVILDHIEDPHNLGAIIRTCEAAGVDGIILPKDRSVSVTGTVMKVSAGAIDYVKLSQVTNLNNTIRYLKKEGFWIVGTDMEGQDYSTIDYTGKCAIVIGNEGKGLARMVGKSCDFIASIPMQGKTNSLNASVAAGIIIFEAVRLRK